MQVRVLSIAGLDPSAGAGMTADVRLVQGKGGDVAAIPTCLTVQNRHGFQRVEPIPSSWLRDAIAAVFEDGPIHAVKIGMIAEPETAKVIAEGLRGHDVPIVVDPVMSATAGGYDAAEPIAAALREHLMPIATVITPNASELAALGSLEELKQLCGVFATGGDAAGEQVIDVLHTATDDHFFENPRIVRNQPVHGTGCALSTLVAFYLGGGAPLAISCNAAVDAVRECLAMTPDDQPGAVAPLRVV